MKLVSEYNDVKITNLDHLRRCSTGHSLVVKREVAQTERFLLTVFAIGLARSEHPIHPFAGFAWPQDLIRGPGSTWFEKVIAFKVQTLPPSNITPRGCAQSVIHLQHQHGRRL